MIGRSLSNYTVLERLGSGAMGEVYRARDERLGREVAVKVLHPSFAEDEERKERFLREAHLASLLSHPNIATIYAADEVEGTLFFAMELVRGETLDSKIRPGGLDREEVLDLAIPIAEGLAEAHRAGVVHRDLKPANVMIDERGRVKILDFGLSKPTGPLEEVTPGLTASGNVMGTPYYMSPEQMRGKKVDPRSDLFALGVTLYQLATGNRPFTGASLGEVMEAIFLKDPSPPQEANPRTGPDLSQTVLRLLEKEPDRRFQNAEELLGALRGLRASRTLVAPAPAPARAAKALPGKAKLGIAAGAFLLAAGLAAFLLLGRGGPPPVPGKPLLALLPFTVSEPDEEAHKLARTILYALPSALASTAVEVLSPSYLNARAKQRGIELDSATGTDLAQQEGASYVVVGEIGAGPVGLDLNCRLQTMRGTVKSSLPPLRKVRMLDVRAHVDAIATMVLAPFGVTPEKAQPALATLSDKAVALQEFADGLAAMEHLDPQKAEAHFAAASQEDPDFALAHYHRARALGWLGGPANFRQSREFYQAAVRDPRRLSDADKEKANLYLEVLLLPRKPTEFDKLERARRLAQGNSRDKDALETWMEVAYHDPFEASAQEAVEACEALLKIDPDYGPAHQHLLQAAIWAGRPDLARKAAETLGQRAKDSSWEPQALLYLGRDKEAKTLAEERGRSPRSHWDRLVALDVAFGLGEAALAEETALQGWEEDSDEFLFERTKAILAQGRFDEARRILERPEEKRKRFTGFRYALLRLEAGLEPPEAPPEDPRSAPFRAGWLARQKRTADAEAVLAATPERLREVPLIRRLRDWVQGEVHLAAGETDFALARFAAAAPEPGKAESVEVAHLAGFLVERAARAHLEAGKPDEAEALLGRFVEAPGWLQFGAGALLPAQIRATYDEARLLEARGQIARAVETYGGFLSRWSAPDAAAPEIEDALRRYRAFAGKPWRPG